MMQEQTLYEQLGGDAGVKSLVQRFYSLMQELPEARGILDLHPKDLTESIEKLYLFLSGWTGGPQLYVAKIGHPMLRRRHFPFSIGESERDQWMLCMDKALAEHGLPGPSYERLRSAFYRLADHLKNQASKNQEE